MQSTLVHALSEVRSRIAHACERSGRLPSEITLLLASKTVMPMRMREAFIAGCDQFGENKAQELLEKAPDLKDLPVTWHFIGQLQSNKVKSILPHISLIHSLDRASLAEEIQKQGEALQTDIQVLIEINSSGEKNKGGVPLSEAETFITQLKKYPRIKAMGLMTVAVHGSEKEVRTCFKKTAELMKKVRPHLHGDILSMGMSGDFEIAIEEGSTMVRIGSLVFGERS